MHVKGKKKISTRAINLTFLIVMCMFSLAIWITDSLLQKEYGKVMNSQQMLTVCNDAAHALQRESDMLSLYVNNYVDTYETASLRQYYALIDERQREQELEKVAQYPEVDDSALQEALAASDALAQRETHAFSLVVRAIGIVDTAPIQVKNDVLSPGEEEKTPAELLALAKQLIYSKEYNDYKRDIYEKINTFEKAVVSRMEQTLNLENQHLNSYLIHMRLVAGIGNAVAIGTAVVLYRQVTLVLGEYIRAITRKEPITVKGTSDLQYLGREYNDSLARHREENDALRRLTEVDALTRIANRRALEIFMQEKLQDPAAQGAFVFLDVDDFKFINDTYGHPIGDEVLRQLAGRMKANVRGRDFVGRCGGDEFAVWLDGATMQDRAWLENALVRLSKEMTLSDGRTISVCYSAGVTFCRFGDTYDKVMYRADRALYEKKRSGKGGVFVYEDFD